MLTFVDFCAGIGGGRLGLELCGLKCLAYAEIDDAPASTYQLLFGKQEKNYGDLTKIDCTKLPDFDVMIGGFPCQTFSIVGQRRGFDDERGQIIYGLIRILSQKNVKYFILENVKGLVSHDSGKTLKTILDELNKIGYKVAWKVLDSQNYGVPQMRERVYFVGIRNDLVLENKAFIFPTEQILPDIKNYLIDNKNNILPIDNVTFGKYLNNKYNNGKFNINNILMNDNLVLDTRQSDLRLYEGKCPTLRTGRHGLLYVKNKQLKKLSAFESLLLQGFPISYAEKTIGNVPENKLLSQVGNAMTVTVIKAIAKQLISYIKGEQ